MIKNRFFKFFCLSTVIIFIINAVATASVSAQVQSSAVSRGVLQYAPTKSFPVLKGMTIDVKDPLRFDFIVDGGWLMVDETTHQPPSTNPQNEYLKLIHYFLAALTTPEDQLWVNLSPDEPDRILPKVLDQTQIGRDLIGQDYLLKQLTASLLQPDNETGKKFWEEVYQKAQEQGIAEIPVDLRQKVWIVPDVAKVAVRGRSVFITKATLKVMTEEDYLGNGERGLVDKNKSPAIHQSPFNQNFKSIILPAIEKEINEGEEFAQLRQMYQAMILASWYKKNLKTSFLAQSYVNQQKTVGIDTVDAAVKDELYQKYLDLFRKGTSDLIREEYDPATQSVAAKHYISGGYSAAQLSVVPFAASVADIAQMAAGTMTVEFQLTPSEVSIDPAMTNALQEQKDHLAGWESALRKWFKERGYNDCASGGACWAEGGDHQMLTTRALAVKASALKRLQSGELSGEEQASYWQNVVYANEALEWNTQFGEPPGDDWAMMNKSRRTKGGIDLNAAQMNLQEEGAPTAFDPSDRSGQDMPPVDPARLHNVTGFVPVILSIYPTDVEPLLNTSIR